MQACTRARGMERETQGRGREEHSPSLLRSSPVETARTLYGFPRLPRGPAPTSWTRQRSRPHRLISKPPASPHRAQTLMDSGETRVRAREREGWNEWYLHLVPKGAPDLALLLRRTSSLAAAPPTPTCSLRDAPLPRLACRPTHRRQRPRLLVGDRCWWWRARLPGTLTANTCPSSAGEDAEAQGRRSRRCGRDGAGARVSRSSKVVGPETRWRRGEPACCVGGGRGGRLASRNCWR